MEPFRKLTGRVVPLPVDDIDTDQIIPARFLKTTTRAGLGKVLFHDWRFDEGGRPRPDFALNRESSRGAQILLAGNNFGCGSSREHAPWALQDFGFRAVISTSFADIFRNNALKNGLLPLQVARPIHEKLFRISSEDPASPVVVDLESQTLTLSDGESAVFPIDPFSRKCLLEGVDELGYILKYAHAIAAFERDRGR